MYSNKFSGVPVYLYKAFLQLLSDIILNINKDKARQLVCFLVSLQNISYIKQILIKR